METTRSRLLQGNEACAEGAVAAGLTFFAGYPISPASEIAEYLAERLPRENKVFIQMEDEIASMAAVIGAALGGARSMTATSGPGFSLMQENIGFAAMAEIPCVIVNVQRAGPSTGLPTSPAQGDVMQARWGTHGDHPIVVMCPSYVQEVYKVTVKAFHIAEMLANPVIVLMDEFVAHLRERVDLTCQDKVQLAERQRRCFGEGHRFHVTGLYHDEAGFPVGPGPEVDRLVRRLCAKVEARRTEITFVEEWQVHDAEVGVIAYGCSARAAREAVRQAREAGVRAGLLRPVTLWPFPEAAVRKLARRVRRVVVPELNLGQVYHEVCRCAGGLTEVVPLNRVDGEMFTPAEILAMLQEVHSYEYVSS